MKSLNSSSLVLITALAAMAEAGHGAQPPDAVVSDSNGNSAMGTGALVGITTGAGNTASGFIALQFNTTGLGNTASGMGALEFNTTGNLNTAVGNYALQGAAPTTSASGAPGSGGGTGGSNTAIGAGALASYSTGTGNTASGAGALSSNTTGNANTASGNNALQFNTTGSDNIAEGELAGIKVTTGSFNIDIGNTGVADDSNTIRIGTQGAQTATYIAGIRGNNRVNGLPILINAQGELGVSSSSERFKTAIAPMGSNTANLQQLRPVTFKFKSDATATRQYGLIAEEVAKVYPELVVRDEKGRIDGVRYDELAPMLLNEVQKQAAEIRALKLQAQTVGEMQKQLEEMHAALVKLQSKDELVAQR
jgi:hypothetical protein